MKEILDKESKGGAWVSPTPEPDILPTFPTGKEEDVLDQF